MKKIRLILCILIILIALPYNVFSKTIEEQDYIDNVKRDLLVLMMAYKEQIVDIEKDDNDLIYIIMKNGKKILYDDKKIKTYDERFVNADLEDTLNDFYPLMMINEVMKENFDPGRIRNYKLLGAMYGDSQREIEKNIKLIPTYYGSVMFNTINNASKHLKDAVDEIAKVSQEKPQIVNYVTPLSGGYNFRYIQDTGLLSPHAYGISIDLNRNDADYWKWVEKDRGSKRIASYPKEVVEIFEKHGFVWGGKWSHFDILHFEYRPEIILKAKYFGDNRCDFENWYDPIEINEETENIINSIDEKIGG